MANKNTRRLRVARDGYGKKCDPLQRVKKHGKRKIPTLLSHPVSRVQSKIAKVQS